MIVVAHECDHDKNITFTNEIKLQPCVTSSCTMKEKGIQQDLFEGCSFLIQCFAYGFSLGFKAISWSLKCQEKQTAHQFPGFKHAYPQAFTIVYSPLQPTLLTTFTYQLIRDHRSISFLLPSNVTQATFQLRNKVWLMSNGPLKMPCPNSWKLCIWYPQCQKGFCRCD